MRNGYERKNPRAFGEAGDIGVQVGLAECRAGRPVRIQAADETVLAMPVDGANAERIAAFSTLVYPAQPRLVITARRARVLGLDSLQPVLVDLAPTDDAASIFDLATSDSVDRKVVATCAGAAGVAALELAKFAQTLPALLLASAPAEAATQCMQ